MYDLARLDRELEGTLFAGKVHFLPVTDSTNSDALAAARLGAPHGSVFLADAQTAGRGREGHAWHSAAGEGLYVSVLLRTDLSALSGPPAGRMLLLPLAAGLAAADAIRAVSGLDRAVSGPDVDLRWPNDLLIGSAKAGGILVEAISHSNEPPHAVAVAAAVVVGVGINVHQRSFPPGLATPATSLDLAAGRTISRQPLLVALLRSLAREAGALAREDAAAQIPARVEAASTWIRGRRVEVHGPQACTGVTAGLDEHGFLRVQTATSLVTVRTGGIRSPEID
jgi:BirA family transcriptional regulator, biotin operon repressor / biotin---[acetyl-CoA-carboxylase] ligase